MSNARASTSTQTTSNNEPSSTQTTTTSTASTSSNQVAGVLKLRGRTTNKQKVNWDEAVIDNEFLNKNKSKICCIYHKPKPFDESSGSSSDSSDDSLGSDDSRRRTTATSRSNRVPRSRHVHGEKCTNATEEEEEEPADEEREEEKGKGKGRNAYDRGAKEGKGKAIP